MGNCIRIESSRDEWADEEWEYAEKGSVFRGERMNDEDHLPEADEGTGLTAKRQTHSISSVTEVKIKITKKQLQQLIGKMEENELSVHEALDQLIKVSDECHSHEKTWRPALQSIPEVN